MSKDKAEEAQHNVEKAKKRAEKKINSFGAEIEDIVTPIIRNLRNEMEENVRSNKRKAEQKVRDLKDRFIFNYGMEGRVRDLQAEIGYIYEDTKFQNKNYFEERNDQIRSEIKKASSNFIMEIEELCEKYLEDFDPKEYISKVNRYLISGQMPEEDDDSDDTSKNEQEEGLSFGNVLLLPFALLGAVYQGVFGLGGDFDKDGYIAHIESAFNELLPKDIRDSVSKEVNVMISNIKKLFLEEFLQPIDEKLQERMNESTQNTQKVADAEQKIKEALAQSKALKEQLADMKALAQQI